MGYMFLFTINKFKFVNDNTVELEEFLFSLCINTFSCQWTENTIRLGLLFAYEMEIIMCIPSYMSECQITRNPYLLNGSAPSGVYEALLTGQPSWKWDF